MVFLQVYGLAGFSLSLLIKHLALAAYLALWVLMIVIGSMFQD